ncbi:hypothetical protein ACLMJK_008495 [Lecanora helva]
MSLDKKKRKCIDQFFAPVSKRPCFQIPKTSQREVLAFAENGSSNLKLEETIVPGLTLLQNFITPNEEEKILKYLNDPLQCTWRTDLSRRTMHFGGTYCLMPPKANPSSKVQPQILQAPPMPEELMWLIQRMVDAHVLPDDQRPQYCIVNEYRGNLGISAHTENFQFAEPVVGLSLLSACHIRFHELVKPYDGSVRSGKASKAEKTGLVEDVLLPGRSLLVMRGESRWKWQHEIVRSAKGRGPNWKRISLTFRYKPDDKIK